MEDFEPTNKKPLSKMSKKLEKNFDKHLQKGGITLEEDVKNLYNGGFGLEEILKEIDSHLNEEEQSFKKRNWDLPKMETLVHSDPILSAEYQQMSEDGQEKYGYHYNETIMNMLFNKYVTNDTTYQQKYLNAVPAEKERRDASGIHQLQQKGEEKMEKREKSANENDVPIHNNSLEGVIEEDKIDKKYNTMNEDNREVVIIDDKMIADIEKQGWVVDTPQFDEHIDNLYPPEQYIVKFETSETTGAASSGAYSPALGAKNNVYENTDEYQNAKWEAKDISQKEGVVQHVNKIGNTYEVSDWYDEGKTVASFENGVMTYHDDRLVNEGEEEVIDETTTSASSGAYVGPFHKKKKDHVTNKPAWAGGEIIGESYLVNPVFFKELNENYQTPVSEHHLNNREDKIRFIIANGRNKYGDKDILKHVPDDTIDRFYRELESSLGINEEENNMNNSNLIINDVISLSKKLDNVMPVEIIDNMSDTDNEDYSIFIDHIKYPEHTDYREFDNIQMKELIRFYEKYSNKNINWDSLIQKISGIGENENLEEKAVSKNQQQFMGMVHAYKKGEMPDASDSVKKAAASMDDKDAKDFASTKHKGLPTKVEEDSTTNFITYNEALGLANVLDNAEVEEEGNILNKFAEERGVSLNGLKHQINTHIQSKLKGSESPAYFKMENIVSIINDMLDQQTDPNIEDMKNRVRQDREGDFGDKEPNNPMGEGVISGGEDSMIGDNPTSMANTMKDVPMSIGESKDNDSHILKPQGDKDNVTFDNDNSLDDFGRSKEGIGGFNKSSEGTHPNFKKPEKFGAPKNDDLNKFNKMTEGKESVCENCGTPLDEDGHCRRDEVPVAGKIAGEKGSCKKKKTDDTKADDNKYNVKFRKKKEKERMDKVEKPHDNYQKELDAHKKQMSKLKEMVNGTETNVNEEKRPSALVQMDRLHKDNEKNFKDDMKDSSTGKVAAAVSKDELTAKEQSEEVPENPYELGEKIEKDKLKQNKGEAFDNVGNSTNDTNKDIPKRNATDEEAEDIMLNRGLGMQDIVYDNEPDERFEERMKKDMGDKIYDQRQDKMDYRAEAPMYNKDSQPIDKGENKYQYDKNKSGYNSRHGVKENHMVSAKYKDEFGRRKVTTFNINEAEEIEKPEGIKLSFDGMGNSYTQRVTENVEMRELMNSYEYYLNGGKVAKVATGKQSLTENVEDKTPINEEVQKMMKLAGYKPSEYVDPSKTKKNAKFDFTKK